MGLLKAKVLAFAPDSAAAEAKEIRSFRSGHRQPYNQSETTQTDNTR